MIHNDSIIIIITHNYIFINFLIEMNFESSDTFLLNLLMSLIIFKNNFVDPAFRLMRFPLDDELNFYLKMISFIKKKNDLESSLIFVLFLKG